MGRDSPAARMRVLYLTHRVPFPPDKGDRIRNWNLLRQLAARGQVWLACLADEPVAADAVRELEPFCQGLAIAPLGVMRWARAGLSLLTGRSVSEGVFASPQLRRELRQWRNDIPFDVAVCSASSLVPYLRRDGLESIPAVVDLIDVDSQKWYDFAASAHGPRRWLYRIEGRRIRAIERGLPAWARAVGVISPVEAELYDGFTKPRTATVAPSGVDVDFFRPDDGPTEQACVFVGAMDYRPNVDGAAWFAREVFPGVRAKYPAAEFWIVGRNPTSEVRVLAAVKGVTVYGTVPDVRPYMTRAAVAVAPLRLARGLQNKVLEALAMGKPTIASPPAHAALSTVPGVHLLSASTPAEWVEAIAGLFDNPARCRELGREGRMFVGLHHHWDRCLQPLVDRIFASSPVAPP